MVVKGWKFNMRKRVSINTEVANSSLFVSMPLKARYLYFELKIRTDKYDCIYFNPIAIAKAFDCGQEELDILEDNNFICQLSDSLIVGR